MDNTFTVGTTLGDDDDDDEGWLDNETNEGEEDREDIVGLMDCALLGSDNSKEDLFILLWFLLFLVYNLWCFFLYNSVFLQYECSIMFL